MKLTDQVYYRKMYFSMPVKAGPLLREVYAALLKGDKNVLVDCGVSYNYPDIVQLAAEAELTVSDIDAIIVTHCHADHTGGIARLKRENPALKVWAHPLCRPMVEDIDNQYRVRPVPAFSTIMGGAVQIDRDLEDGEIIDIGFPLQVVFTPGHSADSLSLYLPEQKVLLSGDAIPCINDLPIYEDLEAERATLEKLRAYPARRIISGFCGLWDQSRQPEIFALTDDYLARIQTAVDRFMRENPQKALEEMGVYVIEQLGLQALPIPIFLTSLKEHMKVYEGKGCMK